MPPPAAIGCREHSGWAVLVTVAGDPRRPDVVDRRRVELLDGSLPRQPYHAAADRPLAKAADLIRRVELAALDGAKAALTTLADEFGAGAVGVATGTTPLPDDLEAILGSHPRLHAAEGALYQEALAEAAADLGLAVHRFRSKQAGTEAAAALGVPADEWADHLNSLRQQLGPPWQQDHKEAASAAVIALLATAPRRR